MDGKFRLIVLLLFRAPCQLLCRRPGWWPPVFRFCDSNTQFQDSSKTIFSLLNGIHTTRLKPASFSKSLPRTLLTRSLMTRSGTHIYCAPAECQPQRLGGDSAVNSMIAEQARPVVQNHRGKEPQHQRLAGPGTVPPITHLLS